MIFQDIPFWKKSLECVEATVLHIAQTAFVLIVIVVAVIVAVSVAVAVAAFS